MTALLIVLANVLLLVSGQVLWKLSLIRQPFKSWEQLPAIFLQPTMIAGTLLFVASSVLWLYALSRFELSRIYPLQSLAYILGAFSGVWWFRESISVPQVLGMLLIVLGAILVART